MKSKQYILAAFSYNPETGVVRKLAGKRAPTGSVTSKGYVYFSGDGMAHRIAWLLHYGDWPEAGIDHINGDKSDNRISNLRSANQRQNMGNVGKYKNNRSGFKGVWEDRTGRLKRWGASITIEGRAKNLGRYHTPEEAHLAYVIAASSVFGDFARAA